MNPRSIFVAAFGLAAALSPAVSRGEGEVSPPPPVPASQLPGSARVAPDPPLGWIPPNAAPSPEAAAATASPQSISVPYAAVPPAAPQAFTLQFQVVPAASPLAMQAVPVGSSPSAQVVHSKGPGPIGRAIGKVGEYLTLAGMTRLYVPTQEVRQVVYTPAQPLTVPTYGVAPIPSKASPQSSEPAAQRKGWLHR